jgi:hypothetical protein
MAGDFNEDSIVDAADYIGWRKSNGPLGDYENWRANFGQAAHGRALFSHLTSVPEPSSLVLVMVACGYFFPRRSVQGSD